MSIPLRLLAVSACAAWLVACSPQNDANVEAQGSTAESGGELTSDQQKFGYAVGVNLGLSLEQVKEQVDIDALKRGLDDAMNGNELAMDEAERQQIHQTVAQRVQEQMAAEREEQASAAQQAGESYLAENAEREGVMVTDSGLQYEVLEEGDGASPTAEDEVTVHYRGTLIDGTEFDSSYARGEPVTFPLGGVIPGWTEGVQLMKEGAKYKFVIPSELAYGARGAGQSIGPNETLIFEVELLEVGGGEEGEDAVEAAGEEG